MGDSDKIDDPVFRRAVELVDSADVAGLRAHLEAHPGLVWQRVVFAGGGYFGNPSLLGFIAENPIRRGRLDAGVVEVTRVILEGGARHDQTAMNETLELVGSGRVAREAGVQGALIDLLCEYGAEPDRGMRAALAHGEFEAVQALIRHGARFDLTVAAALAHVEDCGRLLGAASGEDRHRALALAVQFGHTEIVRLLLDAGGDANRFNPAGLHSHATPLHQAALGGHLAVVLLLVEQGARRDVKDKLFEGTPLGWATYAGKTEVAEYLKR